jgi:hypothetical protein
LILEFRAKNADKTKMRRNKFLLIFSLLTTFVFIYNGCGPEPSSGTNVIAEKSYCGSAIAQSGTTVTITGSAGYYYRTPSGSGLSAVSGTTKPIRYAEYHVVDSAGNIKQCGETDVNGNFSFTLTQGSTAMKVEVISRAYNSNSKASVLDEPTKNNYYKITKTFTPSASAAIGAITASATGTLEGGAFNILDKILDANLFLISSTASCGTLSGTYKGNAFSCPPFSPTSKTSVYWKPGFNPNTYLGASPSNTLSFYDPEEDKLYICGGVSGDVNNTDTDHFDNSIIIHEYGHFIENHYSKSDSPGGSHSGTKALDPRLTLSEGFQNFFQAAVQSLNSDPHYIDTIGNPDGSASVAFYVPMEYKCSNNTNNCAGSPSPFDAATLAGEGNFREFAISRTLFDLADTNNEAGDNVTSAFPEIWAAFTALKTLPVHFRNIGLLFQIQAALASPTDFSTVYGNELQVGNLTGYSTPDTGSGACAQPTIPTSAPIADWDTTDASWGNNGGLFYSADFYDYTASSTGTVTFTLTYTPGGKDLDIHIYKEDHLLFYTGTMVAYDMRTYTQEGGNISLSPNLSAGHYLIVVHYYSGAGASPSYLLRANGVQICPGS